MLNLGSPDPGLIVLLLVATVGAYILKGMTGFGPALIYVPIASLVFGPRVAIASSAFIDLVIGGALIAATHYEPHEMRLASRMVVLMALGAGLGAYVAGFVPATVVAVTIGVLVIAIGLDILLRHRTEVAPVALIGSRNVLGACFAGGISGGLTGMSGPFVVSGASSLEKTVLRRILLLVFAAEQPVKLAVYVLVGVWTSQALSVSLVCAPAVLVGILVGTHIHRSVDANSFRLTVSSVLIVAGATLLLKSFL